jgi:uncharacterized membrane protein YqaE (UPF0057 family)
MRTRPPSEQQTLVETSIAVRPSFFFMTMGVLTCFVCPPLIAFFTSGDPFEKHALGFVSYLRALFLGPFERILSFIINFLILFSLTIFGWIPGVVAAFVLFSKYKQNWEERANTVIEYTKDVEGEMKSTTFKLHMKPKPQGQVRIESLPKI